MEVTQDVLLPILFAAVIANAVLLVLVVIVRTAPRRARAEAGGAGMAMDRSLLSTSYVDRSTAAMWEAGDASSSGAPDEAGDAVAAGANADTEAPAGSAFGVGSDDNAADIDADADVDDPPPSRAAEPRVSRDPLTGLLGPSAFMDLVAAEDARIRRYHRPGTIVVFELDGLDRLTARLGQDAAERVVPALADVITRLARSADHVGRVGPRRFATLLPETDEVAAINYIERVRRACELWLESGAIALQLAVGWAGTTGDLALPEAYRLATDRMYLELRRAARRGPDRGPDPS